MTFRWLASQQFHKLCREAGHEAVATQVEKEHRWLFSAPLKTISTHPFGAFQFAL